MVEGLCRARWGSPARTSKKNPRNSQMGMTLGTLPIPCDVGGGGRGTGLWSDLLAQMKLSNNTGYIAFRSPGKNRLNPPNKNSRKKQSRVYRRLLRLGQACRPREDQPTESCPQAAIFRVLVVFCAFLWWGRSDCLQLDCMLNGCIIFASLCYCMCYLFIIIYIFA